MNRIVLFLLFSFTLLLSQTLIVSGEKRFVAYFKGLEKRQNLLRFTIQESNSSVEAFNLLKLSIAKVAIVRGDILADNIAMKNYFEKNAFQEFKVVSKLKEEFSTFLYFISKNGENDAYKLLNPDPKTKKMKKISIGKLRDLSNIYLSDIAKSVNSDYRFRYKAYSAEESLLKIEDGSIDGAYLFVSPTFALKARENNFKLQNITKPLNIRADMFAKKISEQKAFSRMPNGIRVDNYLIASSTLSDIELSALLFALKEDALLLTNIKPEYGEVDNRIAPMSIKIDIQKAQAKAEAEAKAKECTEAQNRAKEVASPKVVLKISSTESIRKIKTVLASVQQSDDLNYFKPQLEELLLSINEYSKKANKLIKNISKEAFDCNPTEVSALLVEINSYVDEVKSSRKVLASIQSEILKKGQLDKEALAREEKALAKEEAELLKQEERSFSAELEREKRALEFALAQEQRMLEITLEQEQRVDQKDTEKQQLEAEIQRQMEDAQKEKESGFFSIIEGLLN